MMPIPQGVLLCLGLVLTTVGVVVTIFLGLTGPVPLFGLGLCLALGGVGLLGAGFCRAMKKHLVPGVPGHFLLHPRTGTRFSPQQGLAIQRRLDRIRREMSSDSVRRPELETPLPSTPPPWTMEPPPSYDTVMKSQEERQEEGQRQSWGDNQEEGQRQSWGDNQEEGQRQSWGDNQEEGRRQSWGDNQEQHEERTDCSTFAEDSNQC